MPRLSLGKLPSYRRHKATGQAVVTLGGRDYYLGPWRSACSKAEYQRVIREWQASGGVDAASGDGLTVVELLAAFKRHAKQYYGDEEGRLNREGQNYFTLLARLGTAYGRTLAAEFGPLRLRAFRQSLVDEGLARTNINQQVNRIRHVVKWAVENELIPPSIYEALRCVAGLRFGKTDARETEPIKPVANHIVDATLPHLPRQVRAMVELQRATGMRSGEVVLMRTCDITTGGNVWTYKPARHKTQYRGHSRIVYLGPKSQAILRPWLRADLSEFLFQPREVEAERRQRQHVERKTPLTCGNKPGSNRKRKPRKAPGERYATDSYGRAVRAGCEKAFGMPKKLRRGPAEETAEQREARLAAAAKWRAENTWHPHQLRHLAATAIRRDHGLEVARVLLGHKHASITEGYAEVDREKAVTVAALIA